MRFLGYDAFVATKDVTACLRDAGLDIAKAPTSKRDLANLHEPRNAWAKEDLSLICERGFRFIARNDRPIF